MIRIIKHYSPLFNRNYLSIYLFGREVVDFRFTPNIFIGPFEDLVHKYNDKRK